MTDITLGICGGKSSFRDATHEPPRDHVMTFTPWRYIETAAVLAT
jgi:hypothetical protein